MIKLTNHGKETIETYILELKAKRKEILDAKMDIAEETEIPDIPNIISDIEYFVDEEGDYYNNWGVTDNYNSDQPLELKKGIDFIFCK